MLDDLVHVGLPPIVRDANRLLLAVEQCVRYVDDFVLLHESPAQLAAWTLQIEQFLEKNLRLSLKPQQQLVGWGSPQHLYAKEILIQGKSSAGVNPSLQNPLKPQPTPCKYPLSKIEAGRLRSGLRERIVIGGRSAARGKKFSVFSRSW